MSVCVGGWADGGALGAQQAGSPAGMPRGNSRARRTTQRCGTPLRPCCRWVQHECRALSEADAPEVNPLLQQAASALRERPVSWRWHGLAGWPAGLLSRAVAWAAWKQPPLAPLPYPLLLPRPRPGRSFSSTARRRWLRHGTPPCSSASSRWVAGHGAGITGVALGLPQAARRGACAPGSASAELRRRGAVPAGADARPTTDRDACSRPAPLRVGWVWQGCAAARALLHSQSQLPGASTLSGCRSLHRVASTLPCNRPLPARMQTCWPGCTPRSRQSRSFWWRCLATTPRSRRSRRSRSRQRRRPARARQAATGRPPSRICWTKCLRACAAPSR